MSGRSRSGSRSSDAPLPQTDDSLAVRPRISSPAAKPATGRAGAAATNMSERRNGSERGPFWSVFDHAHIPMALVDEDRRYVAVNDAAVELFQYQREDVIGSRAGRTADAKDPTTGEAQWEELRRNGELYGERVVEHASGSSMRVSYAAHTTNIDGQWLALFVTLSAQVEPNGAELISASAPA